MKKYIFVLISLLIFALSACEPTPEPIELDYKDFPDHLIESYYEAEKITENKYIVYYYHNHCSGCETVKQNILSFFNEYEVLPFYIFNISEANDISVLEEFKGTPTIFVMSDNTVIETYLGITEISNFISTYRNLKLDYDSFVDQHLITYQDVLDIQNDTYILYYYLDTCPHCMAVKDDFLEWAFTKSVDDIYFMNGTNVVDPDNIPTELTILNSGTPIIVLMSNGIFTDEYYSGSEQVIEYILTVGSGEITTSN